MSGRIVKIGSMFSGCDGLALAVQMVTLGRVVWHAEIEPHGVAVLKEHWPMVPNLGDVSAVDWANVERPDVLVGGFPCFPAGTLIDTARGRVAIENVAVGDRVWTHGNRWQSVVATMRRPDAPLVEVKAMGVLPIRTTSEHPFLARHITRPWNSALRRNERTIGDPQWVAASELTRDHLIAQPLRTLPVVEREWGSTAFWYMVGRWLGDGWIVNHPRTEEGRKGSAHKAIICCAPHKEARLTRAIAEAGFHATRVPERTVIKFHISSKALVEFLRPFGRGAANKTIPSWVYEAPEDMLSALWDGLVASDGHVYDDGLVSITTVSRSLAEGMARIARIATKKPVALYYAERPPTTVIEGRTVNQRDTYTVKVSAADVRHQGLVDDVFCWVPVRSVSSCEESADVFNFEVDGDNSYVAGDCVVHNCQDISLAGKGAGIEGERSGLWKCIVDAVRVLRPPLLLVENVTNLFILGFDVVTSDLAKVGYRFTWSSYSSEAVGAPHRRNRVFILATPDNDRLEQGRSGRKSRARQTEPVDDCAAIIADIQRRAEQCAWPFGVGQWDVADTDGARLEGADERQSEQPNAVGPTPDPTRVDRASADSDGDGRERLTANRPGAELASRDDTDGCGASAREVPASDSAMGVDPWEEGASDGDSEDGDAEEGRGARMWLNSEFVSWMMGFPPGWVSMVGRRAQLRLLGNSVQPQVAAVAFKGLLRRLVELG